jgi:C4-type Zn-finger protein
MTANDPEVPCPGCSKPMTATERKPVFFEKPLVDITFVCQSCSMRAVRTIRAEAKERQSA